MTANSIETAVPAEATSHTKEINSQVRGALDFDDRRDFADAQRGFVATLDSMVITGVDGRTVWDLERFGFLDGEAPDTVHPGLWRQSQLTKRHGLFKVTDRIHQIRGFDLANMTIIESDTGYIVVDPLLAAETARAGMGLVRKHLGDKPIHAVIYTHSHGDHFGGVKGIVSEEQVQSGRTRIIAPEGFLEHAVSENIYAGTAMNRRSTYMYGATLEATPRGQVGVGLGAAVPNGTVTLISPTELIGETGTALVIDGMRIIFQYTPDSEAPAEMNFHFPDLRALCMAENASHTMHNLYTLRGAEIRDAKSWSRYLGDALEQFGEDTDVMFISHHWPVWGTRNVREFLERQQDLYRYIHDETLRLASHGYNAGEIAELVKLPASLGSFWANRGFYGSLNHNVKAVYQKYLGWFDGNPARLHPHEPVEAAKRYVTYMGGPQQILARARESFDEGDYRWVSEVVGHVVFAEPENREARDLQADAFEQLGYQSESGPWRNFYLTGAKELRGEITPRRASTVTSDVMSALTTDMLLDYLGIRLNGPGAADCPLEFVLDILDTRDRRFVWVRNGVLGSSSSVPDRGDSFARMNRIILAQMIFGSLDVQSAIAAGHLDADDSGIAALSGLFSHCDRFDTGFAIVTP